MTWMADAACATSDLPAAAWTEKGAGHWGTSLAHRQAIRVCDGCPVSADCLLWQLRWEGSGDGHGRHGIYASTTPEERARMAARMVLPRRGATVARREVQP